MEIFQFIIVELFMLNKNDYTDITQQLREISDEASQKILEIYNSDFKIDYKNDSSPLTLADTESNKIICEKLRKEFKKIPIISEKIMLEIYHQKFFLVIRLMVQKNLSQEMVNLP